MRITRDKGAALLGYFQSSLGIGTIIIAISLSIIKISKNESKYMFLGFTGIGLAFCFIGLFGAFNIPYFMIVLFCFVFLGGFTTLTWVNFRAILQKNVTSDLAGRVFGVVETICSSSIPLATLIFGIFLEYFTYYYILVVAGLLLLITSFVLAKFYFADSGDK